MSDTTVGMDLDTLADRAQHVLAALPDDTEAEVVVRRTRAGLTRFAVSSIHQHVGEDTVHLELRVATGGRVARSRSTDPSDDGVRRLVDAAVTAASSSPVDPAWPGVVGPAPVADGHPADTATVEGDPDARARLVETFVRADPDTDAAGYVDTEGTWTVFANTAGQTAASHLSRATIDGIHRTDTSAGSGHATATALSALDAGSVAATALDRARRGRDPIELDPGELPVVLGPEAVATIGVFLGFYGFNGRQWLDGESGIALDTQQFDPSITLVDDPRDPLQVGLPFDTEGVPRSRTTLIDAGRPAAIVHDRRTANEAGVTSTGHAYPGNESWGPLPTDLVWAPGDRSVGELVGGLDRGLYIASFNYCRVLDPKSLVVTGLTRNGTFEIRDGELGPGVATLRFTQSFLTALAPGAVLGTGHDVRLADSDFGAGFIAAPHVALGSWRFTGGAGG